MTPRLLLAAVCGFLCYACSNAMAGEMEKRVVLLQAMHRDIHAMRCWMAGSMPPMRVMLSRLRESELHALWEHVDEQLVCGKSFTEAWKDCVLDMQKTALRPLCVEERQLVLSFGELFCTTKDLETQLRMLDAMLERLKEYEAQTRVQTQKKAKLYRSLGALSGAAFVLILY